MKQPTKAPEFQTSANLAGPRLEMLPPGRLRPAERNARTHSKKQVQQVANSIVEFGFINPIVADERGRIVAGHARLEASKLLGLKSVPVIRVSHLNETQLRALMLADNKIAANAGWDREILATELGELQIALPECGLDLAIAAGGAVYDELKNICVWNKTTPGQGSFYRSQHELVAVYKHGRAPHINTFELGQHGRSRSNVWTYAGVNTFRAGRMDELKMHPTVKPVALIADAMRDCSRRGSIVLDSFAGFGSSILAAEQIGRRAFCIEIDPRYADVAIRRWQRVTGKDAVIEANGQTFDAAAEQVTCGTSSTGNVRKRKSIEGDE